MTIVLDVPCPRCQVRPVEAAWRLRTCGGLFFSIRMWTKEELTCGQCFRRATLTQTFGMLLAAPFSVLCWLVAPVLAVMNLQELLSGGSTARMRAALERAGLDMDAIRVDAEGFTAERRACLDACLHAVTESVWADARLDPVELRLAVQVVCEAFPGEIHPKEVEYIVRFREDRPLDPSRLRREHRVDTLRIACRLALADGRLARSEYRYLVGLAARLGLGEALLRRMLGLDERRGRGATSERGRSRDPVLEQAAQVLGVDIGAPLAAVKRAYRSLCMQHHPDRTVRQGQDAQAAHDRMAELNWAYQIITERRRA